MRLGRHELGDERLPRGDGDARADGARRRRRATINAGRGDAGDPDRPSSASADVMSTTWDSSMIVRRSWRSASEPASGPTTVAGKNVANAPTPDPHRRVRQLVEDVGHGDGLHPRAGVRDRARRRRRARSRGVAAPPSAPPELPGALRRRRSPERIYRGPYPNVCSFRCARLGVGGGAGPALVVRLGRGRRRSRRAPWERIALDDTSWVDLCRGHLRGADTVLDVVVDSVPWQCGRRFMYDRMVDDPRLSYRAPRPEVLPHPVLGRVRDGLAARYGVTFGARRVQLLPRRPRQRGAPRRP